MPTTTTTTPAAETTVATTIGVVESDKRTKSRTVVVAYKAMHPKYGKFVSRRTVLQVHDENNESRTGDTVEVKPCRPISKTKKWTLVRVVERGSRVDLVQADPTKA